VTQSSSPFSFVTAGFCTQMNSFRTSGFLTQTNWVVVVTSSGFSAQTYWVSVWGLTLT